MSRHFTCAVCGLSYHTDTPEVDMNREFLNSGMSSNNTTLHSVCDSCYGQVKSFLRREP